VCDEISGQNFAMGKMIVPITCRYFIQCIIWSMSTPSKHVML
jgi:hypothetical protein